MTALGPAPPRADQPPPAEQSPATRLRVARARLNRFDLRANVSLQGLCIFAGIVVFLVMVGLTYQVINDSRSALGKFGIELFGRTGWDPQENVYGLLPLMFGTLFTSLVSLAAATGLGISIGIYLAMIAPKSVARVVGPLVEMLAAVPSVVFGLIGLIAIAPFFAKHIEPALHSALGWIPLFGAVQPVGNSIFIASLVLTFMCLPIIAALSRDVISTVPPELTAAAEALGATRWEVIRGVVLPTTRSGLISACVLGFGRALGEAIAVTQVIGGQTRISANLFAEGDTLASRIAEQFTSSVGPLQVSVLYTAAAVLLLFGLVTNLLARRIASNSVYGTPKGTVSTRRFWRPISPLTPETEA
jgi:phosphate transport system permease protein